MSKPEKPKPPDDAEQSARFIEVAKLHGADKNLVAFKAALGVIATPRSAQKTSAKKPPKE